MGYSKVFWHFTFKAHSDSTLLHLSRIYDQNPNGFHLRKFLEEGVGKNRWIFEPKLFKQRLKANPSAEDLLQAVGPINEKILIDDIEFSSDKSNPTVKKLVKWRNNVLAHRSLDSVLPSDSPKNIEQPSMPDMEQLINRGFEILNRYASYFEATSFSKNIFESDDFNFVLEALAHHPRHKDREKWNDFYKKLK